VKRIPNFELAMAEYRDTGVQNRPVAVAIGHDHPMPWPLRVAQMNTHFPAATDQLSELALVEVKVATRRFHPWFRW
jgi:hypothetical protein